MELEHHERDILKGALKIAIEQKLNEPSLGRQDETEIDVMRELLEKL